jgi:undecaprenyl-diphosphatase
MVISEVSIGTLKSLYDRPRPAGSFVHTSSSSFPSGHAVAASVTAVALVIALFPSGPSRWAWGVGAALFSFVMALSRAYLAAHWLSDAVAGTLLGTTIALVTALVVQAIRGRQTRSALGRC